MSETAIRVVAAVMATANVAVVILVLLWERPGRAWGSNPLASRHCPRPAESYWVILRRPRPEFCTKSSGYTEDLICRTDTKTLVDLHLRGTTYPAALRAASLVLDGPPTLTRAFRTWFRTSPFADYLPTATS